jgi:hypothetical protein
MGISSATSIWIVQYTSLGNLTRTSFFFEELHAQQWYAFCKTAGANPILWVSPVAFTQPAQG